MKPILYNGRAGELMVIAAFRYCIGRQTYIVSDCVYWLMEIWKDIEKNTRDRIQKEIKEEIARGNSGSYFDTQMWEKILEME